MTFEVRSHCD